MQRFWFTSLDAVKFFEKLNDVIWYINDKEHSFTADEFYDACENWTLLDVLEKCKFNGIPSSSDDREILNNFILQEIGGRKPFKDGRSALMYYSWQWIISYLESNNLL